MYLKVAKLFPTIAWECAFAPLFCTSNVFTMVYKKRLLSVYGTMTACLFEVRLCITGDVCPPPFQPLG